MTPLLWSGAVGSWLFVAVFLLDGLTRPGYHPLRQPVSALALGPRGWIQTTNFVLCGLLIAAGATALPTATDGYALALGAGVLGLALVASGIFRMDPMRGYPPGTPDSTPEEYSTRHQAHDWAGTVVFLLLPGVALIAVLELADPAWKVGSGIVAAASAVAVGAFGRLWEQDSPRVGLVQRAAITVSLAWLGYLFAHGATV
ncbi:DUF998 domain-containing protein [Nocardiopsis sp. B62]|uniref:DUF998 domain-containing protein n=1 Tax=Nocardiopsis sp. B62 TaxID=2824874 RepID=UPI001B37E5B0|nr:DUF998 domain-containing protein [Nocardiopsis sp. B62]MBQ1080450.1 DUF998 domain-containing protein [Nocardiopsis sp. B62]